MRISVTGVTESKLILILVMLPNLTLLQGACEKIFPIPLVKKISVFFCIPVKEFYNVVSLLQNRKDVFSLVLQHLQLLGAPTPSASFSTCSPSNFHAATLGTFQYCCRRYTSLAFSGAFCLQQCQPDDQGLLVTQSCVTSLKKRTLSIPQPVSTTPSHRAAFCECPVMSSSIVYLCDKKKKKKVKPPSFPFHQINLVINLDQSYLELLLLLMTATRLLLAAPRSLGFWSPAQHPPDPLVSVPRTFPICRFSL